MGQNRNLLIAPSQSYRVLSRLKNHLESCGTWNQFISAPPTFSSPPLLPSVPSSLQKKIIVHLKGDSPAEGAGN